MRKFGLIIASFLIAVATFAQISGNVKDQQGSALPGSTVSLLRAKDSSVAKLSVSTNDGHFVFTGINAGHYLIAASHVGYSQVYSAVFDFTGSGEKIISIPQLNKISAELSGVTVTSKKPIVEVKADKTILNVEGTINSVGSDALELLRKSPGVMVDKDDNLSLSGKNGVQVYIDGRPTPLTGKDLSEYLKTIQSSQIESIEIITNPSAKYDAAGNAGIINIRLKKNKTFGTNGSASAGYGIGTYSKYNAGLSLNHRNKNINVFGNYVFTDNLNATHMNLQRQLLDTLFDQKSVINMKTRSFGYKTGMDYFINRFSTIGVMVNGTVSNNPNTTYSRTLISYEPTNELDRILIANNSSTGKRNNTDFNLNYRFADTAGRELDVDADYGMYRIKTDQFQPNYTFDPSGTNLIEKEVYDMVAPTNIDMYTAKADYEQNFKKGKLGVGGKFSYVKTFNDFQTYNIDGAVKDLDLSRTNQFDYKENINALYVNYNRQMKGWMYQVGLRGENTNSTGTSTGYNWDGNAYQDYDSTFKRNYTDLFPSAAITFNKNMMKQWSVSYSRRIDRPAYQDLNPFEFRLDKYTFQKGNTMLRPQYTNSISVTNTYKFKLTTTLNYSHVKDVFTQLIDTADKSAAFISKKNLATQDIASLTVSYFLQKKWYTGFVNVNSYYSHYKADFGGGNRDINLDVVAATFYLQNSFNLGKGYTAELSGWFGTPTIWQGTIKTKSLGSADGGVQKVLFKGKANVKASVSDMFHTFHWKGESNFAGQQVIAQGHWEATQFKLYFTYHFGRNSIKAARQRNTSIEDESKRVSNGGGGIGGGGQQQK